MKKINSALLLSTFLTCSPAFADTPESHQASYSSEPTLEIPGDPNSWRARHLEIGVSLIGSASISKTLQPQSSGFGPGLSIDYNFLSWLSSGAFAQYRIGFSGPQNPDTQDFSAAFASDLSVTYTSSWIYGLESTFSITPLKRFTLWTGPRAAMLTTTNYGAWLGMVPVSAASMTTFGAGGRAGLDYRFTQIFSLGAEVSYIQFIGGKMDTVNVQTFGIAEASLLFGFHLEHF